MKLSVKPALLAAIALVLLAPLPAQALTATATAVSLQQLAPAEAHMAVAWRRNPEREYQREHLNNIVEAVKRERIIPRVMDLIQSRAPEDQIDKAREGFDRIKEALAPISLDSLLNAEEVMYAQVMQGQFANHLLAIRLTPEAAANCLEAVNNLVEMARAESNQDLDITQEQVDGATYLTFYPPGEVPMQPTIAVKDDVLILSSTQAMAQGAVRALDADAPQSKFDDPRVVAALAQLPEWEDAVTVYDGKLQFEMIQEQLDPVREMLEQQAGDDAEAGVALRMMDVLLKEANVLDLEVSVEYTEEGSNHTEALGVLLPGADDRLLSQLIMGGEEIVDWQQWIPASAVNYSVNSGVNLHQIYTKALDIFTREAPEMAAEALMKLGEFEAQIGLSLEDDLLVLFPGESVSVTLPGGQSVLALRCSDADHTRELLHRAVDTARAFPQVAAQQLELVESEELDGFEDLRASFFAAVGARPVIGFKEGWMIVASAPEAAQAVIDTRWGEAANITSTAGYQRFGLEIDGPVRAVAYANTAQNIRQAAQFINQAAAMAPLLLGGVMAEASPEDQKSIQEALALIPSLARIVEKFDFLEATLSVNQSGEEDGTYRKHSVTLIRQD